MEMEEEKDLENAKNYGGNKAGEYERRWGVVGLMIQRTPWKEVSKSVHAG